MPFLQHLRITAIGTIGATDETFSYGLSMAHEAEGWQVGDFDNLVAGQITDLADSVRDFHARAESAINAACRLKMVKLALIGATGAYVNPGAMVFREYDQPGYSTSNWVVPQSALAITLDTARPGASGRGRFFIPMPTAPLDTGMLISAQYANDIRDSAATMIEDLNNAPGMDILTGGVQVIVASKKGYNTPVNSVRVGRVVDTIRSRRRAIPEAYTAGNGIG